MTDKTKPTAAKALTITRFQEASFKRSLFHATLERGTTVEQLADPAFWVHVVQYDAIRKEALVKQFDRIEVIEESGAFWADLLVLSVSKEGARCIVLTLKHISQPKAAAKPVVYTAADFETRFTEAHKWGVMRKTDNTIMLEDLQTEDEALDWIKVSTTIEKKKAA